MAKFEGRGIEDKPGAEVEENHIVFNFRRTGETMCAHRNGGRRMGGWCEGANPAWQKSGWDGGGAV